MDTCVREETGTCNKLFFVFFWGHTHTHLAFPHFFAVLAGPGQADEPPGGPGSFLRLLATAAAATAAAATADPGALAQVLRQVLHPRPGTDRGGVHEIPIQSAGDALWIDILMRKHSLN